VESLPQRLRAQFEERAGRVQELRHKTAALLRKEHTPMAAEGEAEGEAEGGAPPAEGARARPSPPDASPLEPTHVPAPLEGAAEEEARGEGAGAAVPEAERQNTEEPAVRAAMAPSTPQFPRPARPRVTAEPLSGAPTSGGAAGAGVAAGAAAAGRPGVTAEPLPSAALQAKPLMEVSDAEHIHAACRPATRVWRQALTSAWADGRAAPCRVQGAGRPRPPRSGPGSLEEFVDSCLQLLQLVWGLVLLCGMLLAAAARAAASLAAAALPRRRRPQVAGRRRRSLVVNAWYIFLHEPSTSLLPVQAPSREAAPTPARPLAPEEEPAAAEAPSAAVQEQPSAFVEAPPPAEPAPTTGARSEAQARGEGREMERGRRQGAPPEEPAERVREEAPPAMGEKLGAERTPPTAPERRPEEAEGYAATGAAEAKPAAVKEEIVMASGSCSAF
jgi:hypothetical protein